MGVDDAFGRRQSSRTCKHITAASCSLMSGNDGSISSAVEHRLVIEDTLACTPGPPSNMTTTLSSSPRAQLLEQWKQVGRQTRQTVDHPSLACPMMYARSLAWRCGLSVWQDRAHRWNCKIQLQMLIVIPTKAWRLDRSAGCRAFEGAPARRRDVAPFPVRVAVGSCGRQPRGTFPPRPKHLRSAANAGMRQLGNPIIKPATCVPPDLENVSASSNIFATEGLRACSD